MPKSSDSPRLIQDTDRTQPIGAVVRPVAGWLRTIREALDLTLADQAKRLKITPPAVRSFEQAEAEDRITLASLRRTAAAMDCELVYTLMPRSGSLPMSAKAETREPGRAAIKPKVPSTKVPAADNVVLDLTWRAEHGDE